MKVGSFVVSAPVYLLGMKLACPAGLYQLNGVLESHRLVKVVSKGFTNQRVGRYMVPALASIDLYEQFVALLPSNAPH
jgi:hypothetical protein